MRSIALVGPAQSGKDTIAERLVSKHGYVRVAFADELKAIALEIDPRLDDHVFGQTRWHTRLHSLVEDAGWEHAKAKSPDVRRFLQRLGVAMRERDPEYWINLAAPRFFTAELCGSPVVVTDCRFENEADYLAGRGFAIVGVERPGLSSAAFRQHVSETEMSAIRCGYSVWNDGTVEDLYSGLDTLVASLS